MANKTIRPIDLAAQIDSLPIESRQLIIDLIILLEQRSTHSGSRRKPRSTPLTKSPFVGMWADRSDMDDSAAFVRKLRESEWHRL